MNKIKTLNLSRKNTILVSVFTILLVFFIGYRVGKNESVTPPSNIFLQDNMSLLEGELDFSPYWEVWRTLEEKFVGSDSQEYVSLESRLYGSMKGLAESYGDPYTVFLPPQENKSFEESISGVFGGVGMEVGMEEGILTVIAPLKGTPAERAGIQPGDKVIRVDDTLTQGLSIDESINIIRGEKGTEVVLTVIREEVIEPIKISIIRDTISIPSIATELRDDGVYVIELYNFSAPSTDDFRKAILEFKESTSNKLLIDLRGNPGGFLDASVEIASYFLPEGKVIVTEDFGGSNDRIHRSKGYNLFNEDTEIVILVNRGSASASEILAGALSEHGVATLVGEKTFGKGSVQELVSITGDTSLKVTVARWLTPNGLSISDDGITPEVLVKNTIEELEAGKDSQKEAGIDILVR